LSIIDIPNKWDHHIANNIAQQIVDETSLFSWANHIEICGGLRRMARQVHDIDIVIHIPQANRFLFNSHLATIADKYLKVTEKTARFGAYDPNVGLIPVEMYYAETEEQFELMKLIRTGNAEFNKTLTLKAHEKNAVLRFKGEFFGIYGAHKTYTRNDKGIKKVEWIVNPQRRICYKERDVIEFCMDEYYEPWQRNFGMAQGGKGLIDDDQYYEQTLSEEYKERIKSEGEVPIED